MVFAEVIDLPLNVLNYIAEKEYSLFNLDLGIYYFWAGLRILLAILPQTGYIHPDEYFQGVEVFAGDAFDTESNVPLEFNATNPMRSIPVMYLTIYIPFCILRNTIETLVGLNPVAHYLIWVTPRWSMVMLSFISDICLFKICYRFRQNFKERLIIFASSFVSLVFMTRTFTNSIEMMCFNILLCLVSLCIADSENSSVPDSSLADKLKEATTIPDCVGIKKLFKMIQKHTLSRIVPIAIVTVTGFFNCPTFFLFAFTPLFFWFQQGISDQVTKSDHLKEVYIRLFIFILYCIPVISFFVYFDSVYYGYVTWKDVMNLDIGFKNFVVTPYNYLTCDLDFVDVSKYGVNSKPHHLLVNILLTINVFFLVATNIIFRFVYGGRYPNWSLMPKSQSITRMLTLSFIVPVMSLTSIPHQKPWFIFPILLPLIMLYSHFIRDVDDEIEKVEPFPKRFPDAKSAMEYEMEKFFQSKGYINPFGPIMSQPMSWEDGGGKRSGLIKAWYWLNLVCVLYYGFVHQGGIYGVTKEFHNELKVQPPDVAYHLITSHVYPVPFHLFSLKKNDVSKNTNFALHELGSVEVEEFNHKLKNVIKMAERKKIHDLRDYRVFVSLPTSMFTEYIKNGKKSAGNYTYDVWNVYYPHVSVETLRTQPWETVSVKFSDRFSTSMLMNFLPFSYVFRWVNQFSLMLVEIKPPEGHTWAEVKPGRVGCD